MLPLMAQPPGAWLPAAAQRRDRNAQGGSRLVCHKPRGRYAACGRAVEAAGARPLSEPHAKRGSHVFLIILGVCGFASALAARSIDPLVTSIAADFAVPVTSAALLSSAFTLPYSLGQPFLGPLGDFLGKARILKFCLWLLTLCLIGATLAPSLGLLFSSRVGAGVAAGGIIPLALAMIGDRVPLAERHAAIGRFLAAALLGQLFGATTAGILAGTIGWRGAIGATAVAAGGAAFAASWKLRVRADAARTRFRVLDAVARYRLVFRNRRAFVCYGTVFVEGLAIYGVVPFVGDLLEAGQAGGPREAGFVIAGLGVGGIAFSLLIPLVARFLGTFTMMRWGGVIAAVGLGGLTLKTSWPVWASAFCLIGFGFFMLHSSLQTKATELAPTARGSAIALHAFFFFLGQATGPVIFAMALLVLATDVALAIPAVTMVIAGFLSAHLLERADRPLLLAHEGHEP
jgi:predicted MFS family arabinose efflux permease